MFCTNCGAPVSDRAKFCGKCGTSLAEEQPARYCEKCGAPIEQGSLFCQACGEKLIEQVEQVKEFVSQVQSFFASEEAAPQAVDIPQPISAPAAETVVPARATTAQPSPAPLRQVATQAPAAVGGANAQGSQGSSVLRGAREHVTDAQPLSAAPAAAGPAAAPTAPSQPAAATAQPSSAAPVHNPQPSSAASVHTPQTAPATAPQTAPAVSQAAPATAPVRTAAPAAPQSVSTAAGTVRPAVAAVQPAARMVTTAVGAAAPVAAKAAATAVSAAASSTAGTVATAIGAAAATTMAGAAKTGVSTARRVATLGLVLTLIVGAFSAWLSVFVGSPEDTAEQFFTCAQAMDFDGMLSCMDPVTENQIRAMFSLTSGMLGALTGFDIDLEALASLAPAMVPFMDGQYQLRLRSVETVLYSDDTVNALFKNLSSMTEAELEAYLNTQAEENGNYLADNAVVDFLAQNDLMIPGIAKLTAKSALIRAEVEVEGQVETIYLPLQNEGYGDWRIYLNLSLLSDIPVS